MCAVAKRKLICGLEGRNQLSAMAYVGAKEDERSGIERKIEY
jgi:hypothetical protein